MAGLCQSVSQVYHYASMNIDIFGVAMLQQSVPQVCHNAFFEYSLNSIIHIWSGDVTAKCAVSLPECIYEYSFVFTFHIQSGDVLAKCAVSLPEFFYEYSLVSTFHIQSGDVMAMCAEGLPKDSHEY